MTKFRKLVSNLSFSPGAGSQLTFYFRRLKQENLTRKISAVAGALALIVQVLAIASPPTPATASSSNDIIFGGLDRSQPKEDLLRVYDQDRDGHGHTGFKALFSHFGISRQNLANSHRAHVNSRDHSLRSLGRNPHSSLDRRVEVGGQVYYLRPLYTWGEGVDYPVLEGRRADGSYFAVMIDCGNIIVRVIDIDQSIKCVDLKASKLQGRVPLEVTFTGRAEVEAQRVEAYIFKFGDGKKTESKDKKATHTYQKPGKYKATLQVRGSAGKTTEVKAACSVTIDVREQPPPKELECIKLSADQATGTPPLRVRFTGEGRAEGQQIAEYRFNFGDGESATSDKPSVTHTYAKAGDYTATLAVVGSKTKRAETGDDCQLTVNVEEENVDSELAKTARYLDRIGADGQPLDANGTTANAGELIQYTLITRNQGSAKLAGFEVRENINDILEYADLVDGSGADLKDGVLIWPKSNIEPGNQLVKVFTIKVKDPIPTNPRSVSDPQSFDLCMDNVYGNEIKICLPGSTSKQVEVAASTLPQSGPETGLIIMFVTMALIVYFYARNRQLVAEIEILKSEHHGAHRE